MVYVYILDYNISLNLTEGYQFVQIQTKKVSTPFFYSISFSFHIFVNSLLLVFSLFQS